MKALVILLTFLSFFTSINAQDSTSIKLAVLPIISSGIDYTSVQTTESILRMELGNQKNLDVVSERRTLAVLDGNDCADEECAKQIGEQLNVEEILLCKLNPLGEKLIVQ